MRVYVIMYRPKKNLDAGEYSILIYLTPDTKTQYTGTRTIFCFPIQVFR